MSKELSKDNIVIPMVYREVFLDNHNRFVLSSGRISGKTSVLVALWWMMTNKYPDKDIVILQSTTLDIKDSLRNEIKKFISSSGLNEEYNIPENATKIERKGQIGATYFYPITDYKGGQRSRGINTPNAISLVLYEECQKNKDENIVEQSLITFIRQVDKNAKMVIVGNNESRGHWFIDYVQKKIEEGWHYIYANCYDIWNLLSDDTQKYIERQKVANPLDFRLRFLGDIDAVSSDVVFPQFERAKNYKYQKDIEEQYIRAIVVGIDHATANDTFFVVPVAILEDGTTQTLQVDYDDPKETNRTLAPTEQCARVDEFLHYLDMRYGIVYNQLPLYISIDGAASPFIAQLRHTQKTSLYKKLWSRAKIIPFTMKKKDINLGVIKNAFAYGVLTILNEGPFLWDKRVNVHRLRKDIEAQRYKGITKKLDPTIPNDGCDALEYALILYYLNPYNLSFPIRIDNNKSHLLDIRKSATIK